MKKTIAITAALMTLLTSGCGNVKEEKATALNAAADVSSVSESEESSPDESSESEALTSEDESSVTESSEGESGEDSGEEDEVYESIANIEGYKGEYISDGNCYILNPYNYPEIDSDILYHAAELAIDQYNCIAKRDKQGFLDTIDFDRLLRSKYAARYWAKWSTEEKIDDPVEIIYDSILLNFHELLGKELEDTLAKYKGGSEGDTRATDEEIIADFGRLMEKAADNVSVDNANVFFGEFNGMSEGCFNKLCHKYKSIDDSEFFSQPDKFVLTPSEDTKYIIRYSRTVSRRFDDGVYLDIDVIVLDGEYSYHFDDCHMWLEGDKSSVVPFYVAVSDNRWKGLSAKEAGEKIYDEYYSEQANIAKDLYNEAYTVIIPGDGYDSDFPAPEPPTWDELAASGDFALAASEKGLDLSADAPEADGDACLKECFNEGTVYMIHEPDEDDLFFIRYVSPDGKIGEYHGEDNHWF